MRPLACLFAALALALPLAAQTPKAALKLAPPKLEEKPKVKVPEYRTYTVQGFTVLIHDEVFGDAAKKFDRPPLDVLDAELATVVEVVNPKSADALRRLVIWVEWDESSSGVENGRPGIAVAVYRSGSQASMVADGLHPLKANTVDVLNMKSLTQEHQPKRDSGRCVLLHEFAHAVHDQLIGRDSPQVKVAYAQAMERKLYDAKTHYAATSAAEFFAELTCCYLDKLHYYPNTRADLKKHDPATFKLMETVWSGSASKTVGATAAKPTADLSVKLADIAFGKPLSEPAFDPADAKGKIVVVACWGGSSTNLLDRVAKLHAELQSYGVVVVAPYPFATADAVVAKDAATRGPDVPVIRGAFLPATGDDGKRVGLKPPLTLVFNPDGQCVFRGSGFDADKPVRAAVGAKLLAELGGELSPTFKPVADAFAAGTTPLGVLPKLTPLLASPDAATKASALALQTRILAPLKDQLTAVEKDAAAAPLDAFLAAEKLAVSAKGTSVATKATAVVEKLRGRPEVTAELRARPMLAPVVKLHAQLLAQEGGFEPTSQRFQAKHTAALVQLQRMVADLKAKHPKSRALTEAIKLAAELGIAE
jgi:hypothetical protein